MGEKTVNADKHMIKLNTTSEGSKARKILIFKHWAVERSIFFLYSTSGPGSPRDKIIAIIDTSKVSRFKFDSVT